MREQCTQALQRPPSFLTLDDMSRELTHLSFWSTERVSSTLFFIVPSSDSPLSNNCIFGSHFSHQLRGSPLFCVHDPLVGTISVKSPEE